MKTAYEIVQSHDPKAGAAFVRPVRVIYCDNPRKTALVEFRVNDCRRVALAKFENLASTPERLAALLFERLSLSLPDEKSAVPEMAGAGREVF